MKKICSKNLLKLLLAVAFAVTLIAGIFAVGGTAAYASPTNDETIDFGTDGITIEDQSKVNELITILGGTSYDDLSTKLDSAKDASNFVSAKTVTLGGVEFIIAYVSKADYTANGTNEGEIIVTLWMAESDIESKWSNVVSNTPEDDYPTNMYSSSLIRSTLVGTPYLTAIGAETLEGTGEINAAWQPFNNGGAFYDYLATPANMAWQETLSAVDTGVYTLNSNNEAWGTISGEVQGGYDYSSKDGYADWQNDSIWLPALSEVGNKNSSMGLWKTNQVQKSNTIDSWLRTGYSAHVAWFVYSTGNSDSRSVVNSRAVRPAVHLNLKAVAEAVLPKQCEVTTDGTTKEYSTIQAAWAAANDATAATTVKMLADAQTTATLTVASGKNITLDLNGHMLKYINDTETASVITINNNATFTLIDSDKITTHTITSQVTNESVTINGGLITGGSANNGGGVYVRSGTFTMEGGTISGNTAAYNGGGVFVEGGAFKMSGGEISGNTATNRAGGVFVDDGYDGHAVVDGRFEVSGTPIIIGNKVNGSDSNARSSSKIIVAGVLEEGAKIGVNKTGEVATGFTQNEKPSKYFIPDDSANGCVYVSDETSGAVTIGVHAWNDGTVTTKPNCTGDGEKTFVCTECGATKTEAVPALGHDYAEEFTVDKEATTLTAGSKSRHCSRCDSITDVTEIPAILSVGALVGIVIGGVILLLLIVYVVCYFALYRRGVLLKGKLFDAIYVPMNAIFGKKEQDSETENS